MSRRRADSAQPSGALPSGEVAQPNEASWPSKAAATGGPVRAAGRRKGEMWHEADMARRGASERHERGAQCEDGGRRAADVRHELELEGQHDAEGRHGAERRRAVEVRQGQTVIVMARWLLVLAGLLVAVWAPQSLMRLRVEIGVLLLVAIGNFLMHAQLLRRRPTLDSVATALSVGDLLTISLLVASTGGGGSNVFVFYFPALLAISLAFPTRQAVALSTLAVGLALFIGAVGGQAVDVLLVRGLTLGAVAVIGNVSWRLHRARIRPSAQAAREEAQDLFWGQAACLWARWSIVLGGAVLVLARAESTDQLALGIAPVVVLLLANFYLHGRYLLERPANRPLVLLASGLDLGLVAVLGLSWPGQPGLDSPVYLFLYPLVLAVGLVFPPRVAWTFGSIATAGYAVLVTLAGLHGAADLKVLVVRAIVLAAMAGLGSLYWRSVRRQARRAEGADATSATLVWRAARAG